MPVEGKPKRPIGLLSQLSLELGPEPILLAGTPPKIRGPLMVRNPESAPVRLKQARLKTGAEVLKASLPSFAALAAAAPTEGTAPEAELNLRLAGKVRAGETSEVRAELRLPLGTPPGTYQASLVGANGLTYPVTVQVLERRKLRIHPRTVTLGAETGGSVSVRVSATNVGNVASVIPTSFAVPLHPADRGWMYHFHSAAKEAGDKGYEDFLNDFVSRMSSDEPPVCRAKVTEGSGELAPLESRMVQVELSLPAKVPAGREFFAQLRLGDGRLQLKLHTTTPPIT